MYSCCNALQTTYGVFLIVVCFLDVVGARDREKRLAGETTDVYIYCLIAT